MFATVLNSPASDQTARVCEPWCSRHDSDGGFDGGICFSEDLDLDLSDGTTFLTRSIRTDLGFDAGDGLVVGMAVNGYDGLMMRVEAAEATAYALLVQVARARGDKGLVEEFQAMAERHARMAAGV